MGDIAGLILSAGRAGVELALFVLLPVMVVMLAVMRLLEARGWLGIMVRGMSPLLRPFGIPGLGIFAMLQILLVSFAAPVATLAVMDRSAVSLRHLAATLAMVLVLAQANVVFPMASVGLAVGPSLLIALGCGLMAAALCYYGTGRQLSSTQPETNGDPVPDEAPPAGVLAVVNRAGKDAYDIAIGALPMLVLALVVVNVLRAAGLIVQLEGLLAPVFDAMGLPGAALLPIITKFIAGGTAMMAVAVEAIQSGQISPDDFNRLAGLLIHPLDLAGVAVLISAGPRVASVLKPALLAAVIALVVRALLHGVLFG